MMLFFITYEVCSTREVSFKNRACHSLLNTAIFKNAGVLGTFSLLPVVKFIELNNVM